MTKKFLWLGLAAALLASSCNGDDRAGRESSGNVTKLADPSTDSAEIDEALLSPLSQAKNFHHKARVYMTDGNLPEAIAAIRSILAIQFPAGAPEGEDVRLDAYAMLAKLLLASGQPEDAMKVVDDGIAEKSRDSFFLANLYTVKGEIYEAQAADLEPKSEPARALGRAAIGAYDHSIQINETLQKQLYEDVKGAPE
jgi:hypothetical protein